MADLAKTDPSGVYLVDNGRALCGEHLGASARFTGRDISGQPVHRVTPEEAQEMAAQGFDVKCETCGRKASVLYVA